jgi:hypothetical protein
MAPIFTGRAFGFGYSSAVVSALVPTNFQLLYANQTTLGVDPIIQGVKVQSDGVIVSGRNHAAKFTKSGTGTLTATTSCRTFTVGQCNIDLYNNNLVSLCQSPGDSNSDGGSLNVTTGGFSNFIRRSSGAKGYLDQQCWGRGGTYYISGSGWLDGSSGDFKAYCMHSSQTTFDSFSDGTGGNSDFRYRSVVTNGGTDYLVAWDNNSNSAIGKLIYVMNTSTSLIHNGNYTSTTPTSGWYPSNIGSSVNGGGNYPCANNAYVTSTDSYVFSPPVGIVRVYGAGCSSLDAGSFTNHIVTGVGDYDSSSYLLTLTGRNGQADSKTAYLLKRSAGALSSANTGIGYKITNTNGETTYGIFAGPAVYDSSTEMIYWVINWEPTTGGNSSAILKLSGDFSSVGTVTVGSNTFTISSESDTFNSSTVTKDSSGSRSDTNYGTSTQSDSISTTQVSSNYASLTSS